MILGLAVLNFESYSIQSWHTTLLTIGVVTFCTLFNIFLTVRLPLLEVLVLILHVLGVFVVIIPLWVMAPRGNTHDTIFGFVDNGGWNNIGLSSLIGIVPMIGMLIVRGVLPFPKSLSIDTWHDRHALTRYL
jgi:choline transport protein